MSTARVNADTPARLLAVLGRSGVAVPTPDLIARLGEDDAGRKHTLRARVWSALVWLERQGHVRRVVPAGWKRGRPVWWRLVPSTEW